MKQIFILSFLLVLSNALFSQDQCGLQNFAYNIHHNGDEFYFILHEPTPDVLVDNYTVIINDEKYESDRVEFAPFKADCVTNYSLKVQHKELDFCSVSANVGPVCAQTDECKIGEIFYSVSECDSSGLALIELNFEYQNTSEAFVVRGNGETYGEFRYDNLPIVIGPLEAQCDKPYEFVVADQQFENCKSFIEEVVLCCPDQCLEPKFEIISQECTDSLLFMKLRMREGSFGTNMTVQINDTYVNDWKLDGPYLYLETFYPFITSTNTITVCNMGFADVCCYSETFEMDGCGSTDQCQIGGIEYWIDDCEEGDETYIGLDFRHNSNVSDSFDVNGNGNHYGTFAYKDLPVKVGPFQAACDVIYELEVRDSKQEACFSVLEDLNICCGQGCLEPIFEIVNLDCSNAELRMKLELIHPLPGNGLKVTLNGADSVFYVLEYPYVYIEYPITSDQKEYELELCVFTNASGACCYAVAFDIGECGSNNECRIGNLLIDPYACVDTGIPAFALDFEYANVGSEGFTVKGNGRNYGTFKYEDLPVLLEVEDDCDVFYEFVVTDNEKPCRAVVEFGNYCCNDQCSFRARDRRTKCEDGILTEVAFFLEEDTDPLKRYEVFVNGDSLGVIEENNIFFEFSTEIALQPNEPVILTICDSDCCVEYELEVKECLPPPTSCTINSVEVKEVSCSDNGLNLILDFNHAGTTSEYFEVYSLLGSVGKFKYADLPVKIEGFPNAGIGFNLLFLCDQGTLCCQAHLFNTPQCLQTDGSEVSKVSEEKREEQHRYLLQNPVNEEITLISPVEANRYQIYDSRGEMVYTEKVFAKESKLESSHLKAGLYIVRIENERGIKLEKLIIAK
ncbi:T9SS type A sorting domain-containing protein [Portibacter marinus]|uniref:T9SS type A sorting domain-containing protein n=1 Tax=Portibacter marinus TaxID=2898660 RepID=UPI001F2FC2D3|nr:T9SS type A sorting domain-containing protein [Portibacter marinus]